MSQLKSTSDNSVWRKIVSMSVAATIQNAGFNSSSVYVLETLVEMYISLLKELAKSTRSYSDLACRAEITLGDVTMALVDSGINISSLCDFIKRQPKVTVPTPANSHSVKQPPCLQIGERKSRPSHIPDHLPMFPDSYTFVQTPTHKQPVTNYETVREKAATQKRDMGRALTRFIAKTGPIDLLFDSDPQLHFPLIGCRPLLQPYLSALDPRDQVFDEDELLTRSKNSDDAQNADVDNPFLKTPKAPKKRKI